ncbi:urease accessory protein [Mycolicibacterium duvalii]|uniref:Urease accessory protein n=1 Tax=Mycolicibacterium duvalii TaxID=39688 RepID=A0A7I7JX56_9MYCO|nr:urease accessory protein UreD [Mycolicibacterium duvalii]MCV7369678.1 urease accessory protein UreD [Mycolicibacterium duvalii]PEG38033.1 urease accessory protein [Mycolicibacterium duvalii]BBX16405.1 urease accessory protein [Mycolicibacterium duvalii]
MRSDVLIAARRGHAPHIDCRGAIAVRRTGVDTVHLVSSAATPLGGDGIRVRVVVEPGARLRVRSVAATLVLPGARIAESQSVWELEVAGALDLDPEPTIVAASSRHLTQTRLTMAVDADLRLRERVQIGRSGEREGFWSGTMHADVDGTPLLRHRVELGLTCLTADAIAAPLAYAGELHYPRTDITGTGTTLHLARGGCLTTWQGDRL